MTIIQAPNTTVAVTTNIYQQRKLVNRATQTFIVANISDAFVLEPREIDHVTIKVMNILQPFVQEDYHSIHAGARTELEQGWYSRRLEELRNDTEMASSVVIRDRLKQATADDWAMTFTEIVDSMYAVGIMERTRILAEFKSVLHDLGVSDSANPRASRFLPSAVKASIRVMS